MAVINNLMRKSQRDDAAEDDLGAALSALCSPGNSKFVAMTSPDDLNRLAEAFPEGPSKQLVAITQSAMIFDGEGMPGVSILEESLTSFKTYFDRISKARLEDGESTINTWFENVRNIAKLVDTWLNLTTFSIVDSVDFTGHCDEERRNSEDADTLAMLQELEIRIGACPDEGEWLHVVDMLHNFVQCVLGAKPTKFLEAHCASLGPLKGAMTRSSKVRELISDFLKLTLKGAALAAKLPDVDAYISDWTKHRRNGVLAESFLESVLKLRRYSNIISKQNEALKGQTDSFGYIIFSNEPTSDWTPDMVHNVQQLSTRVMSNLTNLRVVRQLVNKLDESESHIIMSFWNKARMSLMKVDGLGCCQPVPNKPADIMNFLVNMDDLATVDAQQATAEATSVFAQPSANESPLTLCVVDVCNLLEKFGSGRSVQDNETRLISVRLQGMFRAREGQSDADIVRLPAARVTKAARIYTFAGALATFLTYLAKAFVLKDIVVTKENHIDTSVKLTFEAVERALLGLEANVDSAREDCHELPLSVPLHDVKLWGLRLREALPVLQTAILKQALRATLQEAMKLQLHAPRTTHCVSDKEYKAKPAKRNILDHCMVDTLSGLSLGIMNKAQDIQKLSLSSG